MSFQLPPNIPLGTYVSDGIRVGPSYENATSTSGYPSYDKYGKGVLLSPLADYRIVPYGDTAFVNPTPAVVTAAGWMTLANGTTQAATLMTSGGTAAVPGISRGTAALPAGVFPDGAPSNYYVQFDYPRVPQVIVTTAPIGSNVTITIFGFDLYGFPLQHNYVVNAVGAYPHAISQTDTPFSYKAFYGITGVYISGATGAGRITILTSPIFGLPYVCRGWSCITKWYWNNQSMNDQYGTIQLNNGTANVETPAVTALTGTSYHSNVVLGRNVGATGANPTGIPTVDSITTTIVNTKGAFAVNAINPASGAVQPSDKSIYSWCIPDGGKALFMPADTGVATATSGDVRGLFQLPQIGETWQAVPNAAIEGLISYYVKGADQAINQLAAGGQPQGAGTVPPLTKADLYGVDQYYTGVHP